MSNCQNCYNGCTDTVSDQCVKYTGINVPSLGIQTGDTLSHVESSIINFLVPVLIGTGVKPIIDDTIICNTVRKYLPTCTVCTGFTLNEILSAIIKAACDLQVQIDTINATLDTLNADYIIECLTGVTASSDTHNIVQATITKLCELNASFNALLLSLPVTYVKLSQLDDLIQTYLNDSTSNLVNTKMVPYAVLPYFGPINFFDTTGKGQDTWDKIYLCNGNNGTPDLRGRALTGVIAGLSGPTLSSVVNPSSSTANPNYGLYDTAGANQITLLASQVPPLAHTHGNTAVSTISPNPHTHAITPSATQTGQEVGSAGSDAVATSEVDNVLLAAETSLTVATTVNIASTTLGEGLPHANIQPVTACYYIQYRPS